MGGYFVQLPPGGSYASGVLTAFTLGVGVVIVLVSIVLVSAWALALLARRAVLVAGRAAHRGGCR